MGEPAPSTSSEESRARLLDAAVTAFSAKGFHGTTTRDIASAAGMSPAALYIHHRSKEELLFLIARDGHAKVLVAIEAAAAGTSDPVDRLCGVMRAFAAHHAREHVVARVMNYELAALDEEHQREVRELRHAIYSEFTELVRAGVQAGVFSAPNPELTATSLLSMGVDIARWYHDDGMLQPEDIASYYGELALRVVGFAP